MIHRMLALQLAILAAGCATNGPDDPLTGTWSNTSCYGSATMPVDIQACGTAISFSADLSITLVDTRQSLPATAVYPRCTATRRETGQRFSTARGANGMTLTVSSGGTSTLERSGCANDADNRAAMADSVDSIPVGVTAYQLSGNTLMIAGGSLAGAYTRSSGL